MNMKKKSSRADNNNGGRVVLIESNTSSSSTSVTFVDNEYMVIEILSRLPVKSLLRFKCVSKRWCSLIQDPYFVDLHSARSITRPGATFFISRDYRGRTITFFGSTLYDIGPHFHSVDYVSFIGGSSFDTFGPHFFLERYDDLTLNGKLTYTQILNGLLFMSFKEETIWILNPSTRKTILLTKTNIKEEEAINNKDDVVHPAGIHWMNLEYIVEPKYGFGFDPVTKKYKVICICKVYIFYVPPQYFLYDPLSLEGIEHEFNPQLLNMYYRCKVLTVEEEDDCCWRRIDEIPPGPLTGDPVYLKGALFWRKYKDDEVIVAFDISTEKFSVIKTPADFVPKPLGGLVFFIQALNQELYVVDGHLAIIDNNTTTRPNTIEIWKLVIEPAEAAAAAADCCWVKETILTLLFDWRKEGYLFEVIGGTNQILLKPSRPGTPFCYYNRDNYLVDDHGNNSNSTCDGEKKQLEFTGKAASFTGMKQPASFTGIQRSGINYRTFYTCTESLWSLNSSSSSSN